MKPYIGGQAIIEGVMMKGKRVAAAVRKPDGRIVVKVVPYASLTKRFPFGLPVIRGIVFLFEMLALGMRMLTWSADQQVAKKESLSTTDLVLTVVVSLLLAVGLFLVVPYLAAWLLSGTPPTSVMFNLIDGLVRLVIFIAYIYVIGLWKDVRRLYEYHGAEHAAVNCYEAGKPLTVANVKRFSTVHVRCGTSLLAYVIGLSIVIFSLIRAEVWYYNLPIRLLIVPLIGGLGYELLRLSARYDNIVLRILTLPGRWTQRITTQKPDARQIEVAIVALRKAL